MSTDGREEALLGFSGDILRGTIMTRAIACLASCTVPDQLRKDKSDSKDGKELIGEVSGGYY
jgi:hypothetical protein